MAREEGAPIVSERLVELVDAEHSRMSSRQWALGEERFMARWRRTGPSRLKLATAAVVALAVVAGFELREGRSLSYAVEGAQVGPRGAIEGEQGREPRLHFSDGSDVSLSAGTRATLRHVDSKGATVSITTGSAYVDITHRPEARWAFEAGPFLVVVTGTAFQLEWDAPREELDLRMDRGSVQVSGPLSGAPLALRSGQHLVVRLRQGETVVRDREQPPGPEPSSTSPPPPANEALELLPASPAPSVANASVPRGRAVTQDWQALLASGDFEAIVQQARRGGIDETIATCTSAELVALADAARYSRHDDVARRALLAERRRFAGSAAVRDAAFLLGRLEESEGNATAAIEWYDKYRGEAAGATYDSDALGRKMLLLQQASMGARAREAAARYLALFPGGSYSTRAQALIQAP
jgi:hypothetical protein